MLPEEKSTEKTSARCYMLQTHFKSLKSMKWATEWSFTLGIHLPVPTQAQVIHVNCASHKASKGKHGILQTALQQVRQK